MVEQLTEELSISRRLAPVPIEGEVLGRDIKRGENTEFFVGNSIVVRYVKRRNGEELRVAIWELDEDGNRGEEHRYFLRFRQPVRLFGTDIKLVAMRDRSHLNVAIFKVEAPPDITVRPIR